MSTPDFLAAIEARKAHLATAGIQPAAVVISWNTWIDKWPTASVSVTERTGRSHLCGLPVVIDNLCKPGEFWIAV